MLNQIGSQLRQSIIVTLCPAVFDRQVLALDVAGFFQALSERCHGVCDCARRYVTEEADHRHRRLLRARGERPGNYCPAHQSYEMPAPDHD